MEQTIYTTPFGEFIMPMNSNGYYKVVIVDISKNIVTTAMISLTEELGEYPTYVPTFSSYEEAVNYIKENYKGLF